VLALFDNGSTYSRIRTDVPREVEVVVPLPEPMEFGTAKDGETISAQEGVRLNFILQGYRFSDESMVIEGLPKEVIIGAKTLQSWRMKLDFEAEKVIIDPRVTKLRLI
jgi:hypothetical protein